MTSGSFFIAMTSGSMKWRLYASLLLLVALFQVVQYSNMVAGDASDKETLAKENGFTKETMETVRRLAETKPKKKRAVAETTLQKSDIEVVPPKSRGTKKLSTTPKSLDQKDATEPGWIPLTKTERLEYEKREKRVCGKPFQHCCLGQCRGLASKHHNSSDLLVKWNQPSMVANLMSVVDLMESNHIPCNLWFMGYSLSGDHGVGAMCELMRDGGYELKGDCVSYTNANWAEANTTCFDNQKLDPTGEKGYPQAMYQLHSPERQGTCRDVTIAISGINRAPETTEYAKRGGVMIWNHGVHCLNETETCIGRMMNRSLATFVSSPSTSAVANKWLHLWRETERQHHPRTKNGYHKEAMEASCAPLGSGREDRDDDWRNIEAKQFLRDSPVLAKMNITIPIIPIAKASETLWRMHSRHRPDRDSYDCTHYCYSPWRLQVTWGGLLKGIQQIIAARTEEASVETAAVL